MKETKEWYLILRAKLVTERDYLRSKKDKRANKLNYYIKLLNEAITDLVVKEFETDKLMFQLWNQKSLQELEELYGTPIDPQDHQKVKDAVINIENFMKA